MPANTAKGWPYQLPADNPKSFPAQSQTLANKLEAMGATRFLTGITPSSGGTITFSTPFTAPPIVVACGQSAGGGDGNIGVNVGDVTTTGFKYSCRLVGGGSEGTVYGSAAWIAVGV